MEIVTKSSHKMTAYFSGLQTRPIEILNSSVKSFSKKNLKKVADELKKPTCPLKALLRFNNNDEKLAEINDVQFVTRNGVPTLKFLFSSENLESKGAYAKAAIHFNNLNNGDYHGVSIQCWPLSERLC